MEALDVEFGRGKDSSTGCSKSPSGEAAAFTLASQRDGWGDPTCARHHPMHREKQRVPGTPSTLSCQGGGWRGWPSLRASTEHTILPGPEPIDPECAVREHKGQSCHPPLSLVCALREHVRLADHLRPRSCVRGARARDDPSRPSHGSTQTST